jgi:serine/threonine protein kinase
LRIIAQSDELWFTVYYIVRITSGNNMDLSNLVGQTFGKYQLTALIGKGGMSAVYRAHQTNLNRDVAFKVISPAYATDPSYVQRFVVEAKTAASLEHNNIVPVYDYGTEDDVSYIVMRMLTGGTLAQRMQARIKQGGPLPSGGEVVTMVKEMAKALGYAHSRGIIHRDIKASNIMFDTEGDPYIVDFGIAKILSKDLSLTSTKNPIGTPTYMAPEQWRDEYLTPATDQYALGILLFFMLTGRLPFSGNDATTLMKKHLNEDAPLVHTIRSSIPEKVSSVIGRAMAKDPDDRYTNVRSFAEALRFAMRGKEGADTEFFQFLVPGAPQPSSNFHSPTVSNEVEDALSELLAPAPEDQPAPSPTATGTNPFVLDEAAATLLNSAEGATPSFMVDVVDESASAVEIAADESVVEDDSLDLDPNTELIMSTQRKRPSRLLAGAGLVALLVVVGACVALFNLFGPGDRSSNNDSAAGTEIAGEVRINPTDESDTEPSTTAVADAGAPLNEQSFRVRSDPSILFRQPRIVVRPVDVTPLGVIVSGHADGRVRMWVDGTDVDPIVLQQHEGVVNDIDVSDNGEVMVTGSDDRTVRVWDVEEASYLGVLSGHTNAVRGVALNSDGTLAASASEDGSVRLWDVDAGVQITTLLQGDTRVFDVTFSPDGTLLAAGDAGGNIHIWDVASQERLQLITGHAGSVRSVAFSNDGTQLASGSTDDTVRLWDVETGEQIQRFRGHGNDVWRVHFSPDNTELASGGRDNNLRIWDVSSGDELQTLTDHTGWVLGLAYSPDGSMIVTGGGDGIIRLWELP